MDANFGTLLAYFDNLLGGGDLGDTLSEIISMLGTSIFNLVNPTCSLHFPSVENETSHHGCIQQHDLHARVRLQKRLN